MSTGTEKPMSTTASASLVILQILVGLVVMVQSLLLALNERTAQAFAHTGLHDGFRHVLSWSEVAAAVLFLIPATRRLGGWCLLVVLAAAAVMHLMSGQWNIGSLMVYAAAVVVTLTHCDRRLFHVYSWHSDGACP